MRLIVNIDMILVLTIIDHKIPTFNRIIVNLPDILYLRT